MPNTGSKYFAEKEQNPDPQNVHYAAPYPKQFKDETIDLYELWITQWNRKWLVIAVTAAATLASVIYALQQQPVYKAEALLMPPGAKDIQALNIKSVRRSGIVKDGKVMERFSPDNVFAKFKNNLSSRTLQKKFILKNGLMDLLAPDRTEKTRDVDIYESFAGRIEIGTVYGSTSVSIEMHDAEISSQWVNDLIKFIDKETIHLLAENVRNSIANKIRDIEYTIGSKRQMAAQRKEDKIKKIESTIESKRKLAKQRRNDQILLFKEAIVIADSQDFKKGDAKNLTKNTQMSLDIITSDTPYYFAGTKPLYAKINILENRKSDDPFILGLRDLQEDLAKLVNRKSDDPFILGLRDLQENLAKLRSIKIEEESLHSVVIDQAAYPPKSRIKPNRRRIVSLGTMAGFFLGIFLAFFVSFVQKQKKIHSE